MIKFKMSSVHTGCDAALANADFAVYNDDDDKYLGLLHWGTGANAGWFFSPESNLTEQVRIADLEMDLEKVMQRCREYLSPRHQRAHRAINFLVQSEAAATYDLGKDIVMDAGIGELPSHMDAIAALLLHYWSNEDGIWPLHSWPLHGMMSAKTQECVSADQLRDIARWVASRIKMWVVIMQDDSLATTASGFLVFWKNRDGASDASNRLGGKAVDQRTLLELLDRNEARRA